MNESARYVKTIEWSAEDQCFVGQCPGVIGPCCHGDDEAQVYAELCQIVDEWIEMKTGIDRCGTGSVSDLSLDEYNP